MLAATTKEGAMQRKAQLVMQNIGVGSSTSGAGAGADHAMSVSAFIVRFDEAARMRLQRMNEKLVQLEIQMQAMEAEMSRANEFTGWA